MEEKCIMKDWSWALQEKREQWIPRSYIASNRMTDAVSVLVHMYKYN